MSSRTQTAYDPEWVPTPFGLTNPNVLCYFNSLMQAMMSCPAPMQYMIEWPEHDPTSDNRPNNPLWDTFHTFMLQCMGSDKPKNAIVVITALKSKLIALAKKHETKVPRFGNGQEDAGEGFHLLLNCMGDDEYAQHFMHRFEHDMYCTRCKVIVSSKADTSFHLEIQIGRAHV